MNTIHKTIILSLAAGVCCCGAVVAQPSDSTRLFVYCPAEREGLHVAAPGTDGAYEHVGVLFSSDYSHWGTEKRMFNPFITPVEGGYVAVFGVNDYSPCVAVTYSDDLVTWRPQDYPRMTVGGCLSPVVRADGDGHYAVLFKTKDGSVRKSTTDILFRHFSEDVAASEADYAAASAAVVRDSVAVGGKIYIGSVLTVSSSTADSVKRYFAATAALGRAGEEKLSDDARRFADIMGGTLTAALSIDGKKQKDISDMLVGVFFEDISYAADGGLYAELVQNRDFEYDAVDRKEWTPSTAWRAASGSVTIATDNPLSTSNPHYVVLTADTIYNSGWDGINVTDGETYDFSFYVNNIDGGSKTFTVALTDSGRTMASAEIKTSGDAGEWHKYEASLTAEGSATAAELAVIAHGGRRAAADMISLFPRETFNGHKNGLRKDIAQAIADLHPKFVRFPGGCMSHGDGIDNIYHWTHSVGPLEDRNPDRNIWRYHQTRGIGFYEYFLFCEDIAAEPLPVLAAGVPCQNSSPDADGYGGQQGGIAEEDMPAYVAEILNLIEWANGDTATSDWARLRAEAGHPAPFGLKYIGIGNEDIISTAFEDRCLMICKAIKEAYPDITVCGTVGPFHYPSSDYVEGWKYAREHSDVIDMVDEHYYETVGWFINNQHYYDSYDRDGPKVYVGEYAARQGKGSIDCALAEALHLCALERNGDIVAMSSYAPLLSKNGHSNWSPDMIYFDNRKITLTPSYETQRLFATYSGDKYICSELSVDSAAATRVAASVVKDSRSGQVFLKIVNVLPTALDVTVSTKSVPVADVVRYEGYSGRQGQASVKTESGTYRKSSDGTLTVSMPPYSLRVVML